MDRQNERMLDLLADLGGRQTKESDLIFEGTKLVIPETMSARDARVFLDRWIDSQEEVARFDRTFKYRPLDGAHALSVALKDLFGTAGIARPIFTFFGPEYPPVTTIDVGVDATEQVTQGWVQLPHLEGRLHVGGQVDAEAGPLFHLIAEVPRKYGSHVEGLYRKIEAVLRDQSIYKGKAVTGQEQPQFVDVSLVDPSSVIYSEETLTQLQANLWTNIDHQERLANLGITFKRAVILAGPYGTGKTLAALLTAQKATAAGITFIQCRPAQDNLQQVLQTAVLYSPAVVFFEDIDTLAQSGETDSVSTLLDMFDGLGSKGQDVMVVMTTNHIDRIHKGMLRPGRVDAVVEIGDLDEQGVRRLIQATVPASHLAEDIDYAAVFDAMKGYLPAFVKETAERAVRYAIARDSGDTEVLTTHDLVAAAEGLRFQWTLMNDAGEGTVPPALDTAFARTIDKAVDARVSGAKIVDRDGDAIYVLASDDEAHDRALYGS